MKNNFKDPTFSLTKRTTLLLAAFLFCSVVPLSFAREVRLFSAYGKQVIDYRQKIDNLEKGDVLVFGNGKYKFEYVGELGNGNTTEVLEVIALKPSKGLGNIALRLPLDTGLVDYNYVRQRIPLTKFIGMYKKGSRPLEKSGIRVPEIHNSYKNQFIALELVHKDFDLEEFVLSKTNKSGAILAEAEKSLLDFVKQTIGYEKIGDFHLKQLVYNIENKEWILVDFTKNHRKTSFFLPRDMENGYPFEYVFYNKEINQLSDKDSELVTRLRADVKKIYIDHDRSRFSTLMIKCFKRFLRK